MRLIAVFLSALLAWAPVSSQALLKGQASVGPPGAVAITGGTIAGVTGVPVIVAQARATAQTAAKASLISYTVGAADTSYEVSGNVLVTASTTHTFVESVTYTDEGNTSRTLNLTFTLVSGGSPGTSIANANGAVPYMGLVQQIRAKAGTTITFQTTGTFTSVTYNVEGVLKQIQ